MSSADFSVAASPGAGTVLPKFQLVQGAASWVTAGGMAPSRQKYMCMCCTMQVQKVQCCQSNALCLCSELTTVTVGAGFLDGKSLFRVEKIC